MAKNIRGRIRKSINFKQTHSERSATNSYRNFGKYLKEKFVKITRGRE